MVLLPYPSLSLSLPGAKASTKNFSSPTFVTFFPQAKERGTWTSPTFPGESFKDFCERKRGILFLFISYETPSYVTTPAYLRRCIGGHFSPPPLPKPLSVCERDFLGNFPNPFVVACKLNKGNGREEEEPSSKSRPFIRWLFGE